MNAIEQQRGAVMQSQAASPAWWLILTGAGIAAGFVAWFVAGDVRAVAAGVPIGLGAALGMTWWGANRAAEIAAYESWAAARGLEPAQALAAPYTTGLLQRGEERTLERAYRGTIAGLAMVLGHYTWITVRRRCNEDGTYSETRTPHQNTVVQVVIGLSRVLRFSLIPRTAGTGWLQSAAAMVGPDRFVELESTELGERFRVAIADEEFELQVRRIFTPALIVQIIETVPPEALVEFDSGVLVVSVPSHCYDPDVLDAFVAAAESLTRRLLREVPVTLTA